MSDETTTRPSPEVTMAASSPGPNSVVTGWIRPRRDRAITSNSPTCSTVGSDPNSDDAVNSDDAMSLSNADAIRS